MRQRRAVEAEGRRMRLARVTARIWVASAVYRFQPEEFLKFRDSLLAAEGLTAEEMRAFAARYEDQPDGYVEYSQLVSYYVDSLIEEQGKLPDTALFDTVR